MVINFDHKLWGKIVPDGPQFCCWGGKQIIPKLLKRLHLENKDRVLDLCCGQGGMVNYMTKAELVVGIDISRDAIRQAQKLSKNKRAIFITGDARLLPFASHSFEKILCRDADVWMYPDKKMMMDEINRVLSPGGLFVWQSYATNEKPMHHKTCRVLKNVGYAIHEMPYLPKIKDLFRKSGFSIINFESVHDIYAQDNLKMLAQAKKIVAPNNLIELLEWEGELFRKKLWTGVLVVAKKVR